MYVGIYSVYKNHASQKQLFVEKKLISKYFNIPTKNNLEITDTKIKLSQYIFLKDAAPQSYKYTIMI